MTAAMARDPASVLRLAELLGAGPSERSQPEWTTSVLIAAQQVGDGDDVQAAIETVLEGPRVTERHQAWARTIDASRRREWADTRESCQALIDLGDPATATFGLNYLMRRARERGRRREGELLLMAHLAIIDHADSQTPFTIDETEGDDHLVFAQAWRQVCGLDLLALADLLEQELPATDYDWLDAAVAVTVSALRTPAQVSLNSAWLRGRALRSLFFAIPPDGHRRFDHYWPYLTQRQVAPGWAALVGERHVQALLNKGRGHDALTLVARLRESLGSDLTDAYPMIKIIGAQGRAWRSGGDPQRALDYSNELMDLITRYPTQVNDAGLASFWLNRAFALIECGRTPDAYEAAGHAYDHYHARNLTVGMLEAKALQLTTDPDRTRSLGVARELLTQDSQTPLAAPVRADTLRRIAEFLAENGERPEAQRVLELSYAAATPGTQTRMLAALTGARLGLNDQSALAGSSWEERAFEEASSLASPLLRARASLVYAVRLAQQDEPAEARTVGYAALDHLAAATVELTAGGIEHVITSVRADLLGLLKFAILQGDGDLALRIMEAGRSIRLAAMLALQPDDLPAELRQILAEITITHTQAPHEASRSGAVAEGARQVEELCGEALGSILLGAPVQTDSIQQAFPSVHLVSTAVRDNTLYWVWRRPDRPEPQCGTQQVTARALGLLAAYQTGQASTFPGDPVSPLAQLLPQPLLDYLDDSETLAPVLLCPAGPLWHVPYPAIPLSSGRRIAQVAELSLTPSLRLAAQISTADLTTHHATQPVIQGYFNPTLDGARRERSACKAAWGHFDRLKTVADLGATPRSAMTIISTHASPGDGLAQRLIDHQHRSLSAAQCLTRHFSPVVILGTCHGFTASSSHGEEPIGLLTVIYARGARWVVGGHQELYDPTVGWILSRTYQNLARGDDIFVALRRAQVDYLDGASQPGTHPDLDTILAGAPDAAERPWNWALTISGLPPARG